MNLSARTTALALLLLSLSTPAWGQNDFMYTPRPAAPGDRTSPGDGVLVREIQVRKGDTLSGISRRFSGRGSYYPQILLFNDIKNPHLIHTNDRVRVPIRRGESPVQQTQNPAAPPAAQAAQPVGDVSLNDLQQPAANGGKKSAHSRKQGSSTRSARKQAQAERKQFNRAVTAYRREEWTTALRQFDRFLADNPSSPLAADASLFKADCYLKLSTQ